MHWVFPAEKENPVLVDQFSSRLIGNCRALSAEAIRFAATYAKKSSTKMQHLTGRTIQDFILLIATAKRVQLNTLPCDIPFSRS